MNIKQWRDRITEQADAGREQFRNFWTNLAPRERLILGLAAGFCGLVIISFGVRQAGQLFLHSGSSLEESHRDAQKIKSLIEELKSNRFQARRYDRLKDQRPEDFNLESHLNEQAQRYGISIQEIRPQRTTSAAAVDAQEKLFEVIVQKGISLDASLRFLESIEDTLGLRLVELTMKPEFADPSKLNVNFVLALKEQL